MSQVNINRVVVTGNLTADPELRSLPSGTSVCKLRIACNTRRKDAATNAWVDKPNYFDVTAWGAQGENANRFLSKGRGVAVDGRLEWREWEADDGTTRQTVEIIADSLQFLGAANGTNAGEAAGPSGPRSAPASRPGRAPPRRASPTSSRAPPPRRGYSRRPCRPHRPPHFTPGPPAPSRRACRS